MREQFYDKCLNEVKNLIPQSQYAEIMSQNGCELDVVFMGFLDIYKPLSLLIPKEFTVIDFGCNLAEQCFFFAEHKRYIGVDLCNLKRFYADNTMHYVKSIQNFIRNDFPKLKGNNLEYCAICSYVTDLKVTNLVKRKFRNSFCFVPPSPKCFTSN